MEVGVDYLKMCEQELIGSVLNDDDDAMPELVKEILYFRTNEVGRRLTLRLYLEARGNRFVP